jgi:hypothetical protein
MRRCRYIPQAQSSLELQDKERRMKVAQDAKTPLSAMGMLLAAALVFPPIVRSQEPQRRCELRVEVRGEGIPLLSKIPYFGEWFGKPSEVASAQHACHSEHVVGAGQAVEGHVLQLGWGAPVCEICPLPSHAVVVARDHSPFAGENGSAERCCGTHACAAKGTCCEKAAACCQKCPASEASQAVAGSCRCLCCDAQPKWEKIAHMAAENAALQARLEEQERIIEVKEQMLEALAKLTMEKAKLEAKLEMVGHRDEMLKEMVELQAENARLKLEAQLAKEKEALATVQFGTMLENKRLKLRVAELEAQDAARQEDAHAAGHTKGAMKPR